MFLQFLLHREKESKNLASMQITSQYSFPMGEKVCCKTQRKKANKRF
jgi:hypothetical protein